MSVNGRERWGDEEMRDCSWRKAATHTNISSPHITHYCCIDSLSLISDIRVELFSLECASVCVCVCSAQVGNEKLKSQLIQLENIDLGEVRKA